MKRLAWLILVAGCSKPLPEAETLAFQSLGAFEYTEKMKLPADVTAWNGRVVKATGFINPLSQTRNLTGFLLVKDRASCCYGKMPQMNHYINVKLKPGQSANYSTDPVTIQGLLKVEERFDGDWPLGLYWMEAAEVVR
ncbi:MAG: DUF3299 domain-containing protein [Planctomycetes bacterium]|nr:DUF3299 domain-containing protein [Planctomycetota bacterium]